MTGKTDRGKIRVLLSDYMENIPSLGELNRVVQAAMRRIHSENLFDPYVDLDTHSTGDQYYRGDDVAYLLIYAYRYETDEEFEMRKQDEQAIAEKQLETEYETFARLKKKFEVN